jgi:hypothetical protein
MSNTTAAENTAAIKAAPCDWCPSTHEVELVAVAAVFDNGAERYATEVDQWLCPECQDVAAGRA